MKLFYFLTTVYLVLTLSASITASAEEFAEYLSDGINNDVVLHRVKRGKSKGSKSKGSSYPKQPGYNPNYPGQGSSGHNYGTGGLGGAGLGKTKSKGLSKGMKAGLAGGALGAAVGAYGGYKLGKMVGKLGNMGHYGYYGDDYRFIRCDPPPRIETDPATGVTYIPKTVNYDPRCDYYDRMPPQRHPYYERRGYDDYYYAIPLWTIIKIAFFVIVVVGLLCMVGVYFFMRNNRSFCY